VSFYSAENISFLYGDKQILNSVSLEIEEGSIVSLLGSNGAGKSTLMKLFLGLLKPNSGEIRLKGKLLREYSLRELSKSIAYVPQSSIITFAFTSLDVVLMARVSGQTFFSNHSRYDIEISMESLRRLGIEHLSDRTFQTLSGGEKQLVLIARALAQEAKILVMDEPVSGLDYGNQLRLLEAIVELSKDGYTVLKSTHFPEHALLLGGEVVAIRDGGVFAKGKSSEIIDENLINTLYDTSIFIKKTECGFPVCVPKFYKNREILHTTKKDFK
jgi:iron complex transport system ATP-binding protein